MRGLGDEMTDIDDMDAESFVRAYVNIVAGACIFLGLRFAGTRDRNSRELLYRYAIHFFNEIMAGSGHLQMFRLLKFPRTRNSVDGHANYGTQIALKSVRVVVLDTGLKL